MPNIINITLRGLEVRFLPSPSHPPCAITDRPAQAFFGIVIIGLSGHLVTSQSYGSAPTSTKYNIFLGVWIVLVSFLGFLGSALPRLEGILITCLDALSVLLSFAGGVVSGMPWNSSSFPPHFPHSASCS